MPNPRDAMVYVGLDLRGTFDPSSMSKQLGLTPTNVSSQGDRIASRTLQHSSWTLWSDAHVDDDRIEPHLDWLLGVIEPRAEALRAVLAEVEIDGHVNCYWESSGRSGGPWITPTTMGRLSELGLPLVISFYATENFPAEGVP